MYCNGEHAGLQNPAVSVRVRPPVPSLVKLTPASGFARERQSELTGLGLKRILCTHTHIWGKEPWSRQRVQLTRKSNDSSLRELPARRYTGYLSETNPPLPKLEELFLGRSNGVTAYGILQAAPAHARIPCCGYRSKRFLDLRKPRGKQLRDRPLYYSELQMTQTSWLRNQYAVIISEICRRLLRSAEK